MKKRFWFPFFVLVIGVAVIWATTQAQAAVSGNPGQLVSQLEADLPRHDPIRWMCFHRACSKTPKPHS
jgi:hypothetical protein